MTIDIPRLRKGLEYLPEWEAQKHMAPGQNPLYRQVPADHKLAAVMALIYPHTESEHHVLLIERAVNDHDKHGGQLGFPGGKFETEDESMLQCALREVDEEVGIAPELITVVGPLSPLYVFASNFHVHPFVGVLDHKPALTLQESEVQRVVSLPVADLLADITKGVTEVHLGDALIPDVPYYKVQEKVLWGATAMIMSELEAVIRQFV